MKFIDIIDQDKTERETILDSIRAIVERGDFIMGREVDELEQELKKYLKINNAILVSSGTDALLLALLSLDLPPRSEVITTPFTFFATTEAIINAGLKPIYVDIDPSTYNLDISQIESKITSTTGAILPVHLFGRPANMSAIMGIANKYGLKVVEDCAQAFGARLKDQNVGTFGDFGCFSFYPTKNLGAYGDAGLITTNDDHLASRVSNLRNQGATVPYQHERVGYNSRCDTIQAAVLKAKLPRVETLNQRRVYLASLYRKSLSELREVKSPVEEKGCKHIYHQFAVEVPKRDQMREQLKHRGIPTAVYYEKPLHLQQAVQQYGYRQGDMPQAEKVADHILSLPIHPGLKEGDISQVTEAIKQSILAIK